MDIANWLTASLDDTVDRMRQQVLEIVPPERRQGRLPDGNPIAWTSYHVARHAEVALRVLEPVDVAASLAAQGIDLAEYGWLARTWGTTVADLVRRPIIEHVTHHVGEMITNRNLMGLSPFR